MYFCDQLVLNTVTPLYIPSEVKSHTFEMGSATESEVCERIHKN